MATHGKLGNQSKADKSAKLEVRKLKWVIN